MSKKKKAALILGAGLCLVAGAGSTLAYMKDSKQTVNQLTFAGEKGLDAILTEPSWESEKGLLTVPGAVVFKDPQITNTSELDLNELAALKCQFVYTDGCPDKEKRGKLLSSEDMEKVLRVYSIDYNSDDPARRDWIRFENQTGKEPEQYFYYSGILRRNPSGEGETTPPLFTKIWVEKSVNSRRQEAVRDIGGVEIRISGQVLQQMTGEAYFGLDNPKRAYEAGLFGF